MYSRRLPDVVCVCAVLCPRRFRAQVCDRISSATVRDIDMKPKGGCIEPLEWCNRLLKIIPPPFTRRSVQ